MSTSNFILTFSRGSLDPIRFRGIPMLKRWLRVLPFRNADQIFPRLGLFRGENSTEKPMISSDSSNLSRYGSKENSPSEARRVKPISSEYLSSPYNILRAVPPQKPLSLKKPPLQSP